MANKPHCIFEFDYLVAAPAKDTSDKDKPVRAIPPSAFNWLDGEVRRRADQEESRYARCAQWKGQAAVQVLSHVGVLRTPCGTQIEVLPKIGRHAEDTPKSDKDSKERIKASRSRLIEMLCCLQQFKHLETERAQLLAKKMPLWEVFIAEFLRCVEKIVKRGLRSDYVRCEDNLFALRGKLLMAQHLRQNLCRRDRFYTAFDEFSPNRAENRLLHSALQRVRSWARTPANQRLARELCFVFADIPTSADIAQDFQKLRLDRGMVQYEPALDWARLILAGDAPLPAAAKHAAPSLLFPMEKVFEAFVAKHLRKQLEDGYTLKAHSSAEYLVKHQAEGEKKASSWFQLKPDLMIQQGKKNIAVLDTKWKVLDSCEGNSKDKYGLAQADFYQLYAYGQYYLGGKGDLVLIYPRTEAFAQPLPVFKFNNDLRLWVLPFDLKTKRCLLPDGAASLNACFLPARN